MNFVNRSGVIILLVIIAGVAFLVWGRPLYNVLFRHYSFDRAIVYNNSNGAIVVYPVESSYPDKDTPMHIRPGIKVEKNQKADFKHAGVFIAEMEHKYFKYSVANVVWTERENVAYGTFSNMKFQINSDGKLFVLKPEEGFPISEKNYQPSGYPLTPEKLEKLENFKMRMN